MGEGRNQTWDQRYPTPPLDTLPTFPPDAQPPSPKSPKRIWDQRYPTPPHRTTKVGGTHPTGMFSFFVATFVFLRLLYMSRYVLETPVPPADLIALSPGYRVPPDLATVPYAPWHTRFALLESATSDWMFETMLLAPWRKTCHRIMS